jgi:antagonist of KipI
MPSLEVIKPGLLTSIQDFGRRGLSFFAIPGAGVMDQNAARIALLLLQLSEDHPLIECTSIAPQLRFNDSVRIALAGADFNWRLNDTAVAPNAVLQVKKGDLLRGQYAKEGLRAYIAIDGVLRVDKIYNSYATYQAAGIGGLQGRALQKGDILEWDILDGDSDDGLSFSIFPGPEFDYLSEEAKTKIRNLNYTISPDSNRMGLRLQGVRLKAKEYQLTHSRPVLPGFIQLPPSGLPIIVLQDGQTTGGYPRIAYMREQDLWRLNQVRLGAEISLKLSTP